MHEHNIEEEEKDSFYCNSFTQEEEDQMDYEIMLASQQNKTK